MLLSHLLPKKSRRDVRGRIGAMRALLAASTLAVTACGHYSNPFAVLAVSPKDPAENSAVQAALAEFAQYKNLRRTPSYQSSSDWPELKQEKERTIYYESDRGFYLRVYAAYPECITIQFIERARDWTPQSLAGLDELRRTLMKIAGDRVRLAIAPSEWKNATGKLNAYCANRDYSNRKERTRREA